MSLRCIFCFAPQGDTLAGACSGRIGRHAYSYGELSKREKLVAAGYDDPTCDLIDSVVEYSTTVFNNGMAFASSSAGSVAAPLALVDEELPF